MKKSTIFLIDGSSFLYRAYYGVKPLHTNSGEAVHAVYGFCRMIHKLIKKFDIKNIAIVWDSKGKNHRHVMFPEYKATRQSAPSDLFSQKDHIVDFAKMINLAQISQPGIEADDILYSLAQDFSKDQQVIIVTSDKDLAQTITENISLYDAFKDELIDRSICEKKYELPVEKLAFYFALIGDAADNIPGVKGVGPKTALKIVNQCDSLIEMYESIENVDTTPRIKALLIAEKSNAFLSLELFTLRYEQQPLTLKEIEFDEKNWSLALPFFQKLEFKQFIQDLNLKEEPFVDPERKPLHEIYKFTCVKTEAQLIELAERLKTVKEFALDTETDGLDPMKNKCVGISIAYEIGSSFYIPFAHQTEIEQLDLKTIQKHLNPIFQDKQINKILHHAIFDYIVMQQVGMLLESISFDTLVAAGLLNKPWEKKGLKELSFALFNEEMIDFSEIMKNSKAKSFDEISLEVATNYAAADAHQTLKLKYYFEKKLQEIGCTDIFYAIEMPLIPILAHMQIAGIYCKASLLHKFNIKVTEKIDLLISDIFALTGITINLNSPKQVAELLFDVLKLPVQKNNRSTDVKILTELAKKHPVAGLILEYRELFKLKSTYLEALPESINRKTGKIHSSFNLALAATGRLSSSNPNLQNIPTNNEINIRAAFQAEEGRILVAADYSQIELRVLAYISQDPVLMKAFIEEQDIHQQTAAFLFQTPEEMVTSEQRDVGKKINFSVLYGLTAYSLAGDLAISFKDAKNYIESYFARYSKVKEWMNTVVEKTKSTGYTETLYGRKRWVPGINDANKMIFEASKRIAINTPVQGAAAEIMKIGMIKTVDQIRKEKIDAELLLQVHDEIIFSVKESDLARAIKVIQEELESVVAWPFPLKISINSGKSWGELSK